MINSNWQKQDEHRLPTLKKRNPKKIEKNTHAYYTKEEF